MTLSLVGKLIINMNSLLPSVDWEEKGDLKLENRDICNVACNKGLFNPMVTETHTGVLIVVSTTFLLCISNLYFWLIQLNPPLYTVQ